MQTLSHRFAVFLLQRTLAVGPSPTSQIEPLWKQFQIVLLEAAESFNRAVQTIVNLANGFNKSAKVNRNVLRVAAFAFFFAAIISFLQGLSII